ncbi:MAG: M12 family metallo-peptidase [Bacteroidales bacterium]
MKRLPLFILLVCTGLFANAQTPSLQWEEIHDAKKGGTQFVAQSIFTYLSDLEPDMRETASDGALMMLNYSRLQAMVEASPRAVIMDIPYMGGVPITIELIPNRVVTEDFLVTLSSLDGAATDYKPGLYFKGVIAGDPGSTVAISFFDNQVIGILNSTVYGTMELGALDQDAKGRYVLYRAQTLRATHDFHCDGLEVEGDDHDHGDPNTMPEADPNKCVRIYFECEYDMYVANGSSVTNTINFMTAVYNVIALLYSNDGIQTAISEIYVWNTPDTYATGPSTSDALYSFRTKRPSFNGNVAHLVSRGAPSGGGVAWLNTLCGSYAYAYSYIYQSYSQFPTYSWTVNVITHEMGHNLGSNHTHDCVWDVSNNGIANEMIDGCGPAKGYTSGTCTVAPLPANGGTIMSYCHLVSGVGINFNQGFGPLPAARIQSKVYNATCLSPCNTCPIIVSLTKNDVNCYGASTGSVTATAAGGIAPYTYSWSNNMTGSTISGLPAGNYTVTITDNGSQCSIMESIMITQPAALSVTGVVSPETFPGAYNGQIDVTVSGGTAPYAYQWSANAGSATSQDVSSLSSGTYSITVTDNKNCISSKDFTVTSVQPCVPPTLTMSSTNVSCNGGNNGTAQVIASGGTPNYTYHWSNNAASDAVTGLNAGTYTVTVTDAANCTATGSVTISQPTPIQQSFVITPATAGLLNGAVYRTVTGGTPTYACDWCVVPNAINLIGVAPGDYTASVTDAHGCIVAEIVNVPVIAACANTVSSFPYAESFESGTGLWTQPTNDNFDWTNYSGSTPTKNTGPTSAAAGTKYMYTESDGNSGIAYLESPCFDISGLANPTLSFAYHMYGNNMGALTLEFSTDNGTTWTSLWYKSGKQTNTWFTQSLALPTSQGSIITLRFTGAVGGMRSDMAIDNIQITGTQAMAESFNTLPEETWTWTSLYPNPASNQMTLRIFADAETEVQVYLSDALGRKFNMGDASLAPGENNIAFPLDGFSAGVYYITAGTGKVQVTKMLLIKP